MNSVHDMGGMHGLGPVAPESDEPVFHGAWEARVLALTLAVGAWGRWTLDESRHERERIPGEQYLVMSYYEKWLSGLISLSIRTGLVTADEVAAARPAPGFSRLTPPLSADRVGPALARGGPTNRAVTAPRRFAPGDHVRARTINPVGHTRLPRYARGRAGVIERLHGAHVLPDANAHGLGECPEPLYGVRFLASELWGETVASRDVVHLDLWESYLEPA